MYFIYKISNQINDKLYIGITDNVNRRWYAHKYMARNPQSKQHDAPLYVDIREYGEHKFSIEVIDEGKTYPTMSIREQYWIQKLSTKWPNGYNKNSREVSPGQCRLIEENKDQHYFAVYTYTSSLNDEVFAIFVDDEDQRRCCSRNFEEALAGQQKSLVIRVIQAIWQKGGRVIIRKVDGYMTIDEAYNSMAQVYHQAGLVKHGSIAIAKAKVAHIHESLEIAKLLR